MSKMEEIQFPLSHTSGLKEIYFTYLKSKLEGDYCDGKIRVGCNKEYCDRLDQIFIHEVGHHVDEETDWFSGDPLLVGEWVMLSGSMVHARIKSDVAEYWAIGFEKYYTGNDMTSESHPFLWTCIDRLHHKKTNR